MTPHPSSLIPHPSLKGFTLIELLVVIGIIAILAGVLFASFNGSTESARTVKCMANLKNLSAVWNSQRAGSQEQLDLRFVDRKMRGCYFEAKGWVSSDTRGLYDSESHQTFQPIGFLETDKDTGRYAITNGWMYGALSGNNSAYVCPAHLEARKGKAPPLWSYVMNAYFGWDAAQGAHTYTQDSGWVQKSRMPNADRVLLFAELPFKGMGPVFPDGESGKIDSDGVLQYKGCSKADTAMTPDAKDGDECIGCNHKIGKNWAAHVSFADGHVERLTTSDISDEALRELTTWLCTGAAVSRTDSTYEKIE